MKKNNKWLFLALSLAIACGGGSGSEEGEGSEGSEEPEGPRGAGGEVVSEEAQNHWREGLQLFNQYEEAGTWNEANCSRVNGAFEEANDAQDDSFSEAIYMMGMVAERCGDTGAARRHYNNSLQIAERGRRGQQGTPPPNSPLCKARVAVGLMDLQSGNRTAARQAFDRSIRDDPRCTSGYTNVAIMQREDGQIDEALSNLRRALAVESDYLPAFNQMALLHYGRGAAGNRSALDLAEVVCRQAQLIDGEYAPIYNTWGLVKMEKGDVIEALRYFERAAALDADMFEAQMNFGQVTQSFRGYQDARRSFARAVELQPENYDAHIGLGAALRGLTQYAEAQAEYERAIAIDGNRPEAYFNLGVLYQDYLRGTSMEETIGNLNRANGYYDQFVGKARGNAAYTEASENVTRTCQPLSERALERARRRGRRVSQYRNNCRPGRKQVIQETIAALREAEQMQREAEQMQREAEAMQREAEAQQQAGAEGGQ